MKSALEAKPPGPPPDLRGMPASLRELAERPPLPNAWVSEVSFNALMMAYQASVPRREFEAWVYDRNKKLLQSPLYRVLFLVVSPERLFNGVSNRWGAFRRGSRLELLAMVGKSAELALHFPAHLHDEVTLGNMVIALRAAAEAAGARSPEVRLSKLTPTRADITTRWE